MYACAHVEVHLSAHPPPPIGSMAAQELENLTLDDF
jgi:hypothetical protein